MAWFSFFRRRHRSPNRQYHVILPDGTERNFELEVIGIIAIVFISATTRSELLLGRTLWNCLY